MSATAMAISSAASANAAAAAASARARRAECMATLDKYEAGTATVEQAREYASCVYTIHGSGKPIDPMSAALIKVAIILAFLGAGVGWWFGARDDGWPLGIAGALVGACLFPCGLGLLLLAGAGLRFLFS